MSAVQLFGDFTAAEDDLRWLQERVTLFTSNADRATNLSQLRNLGMDVCTAAVPFYAVWTELVIALREARERISDLEAELARERAA